jgi:IS30 family transposase
VEKRSQIGHWEGDTLIGKGHKQAIVSLVERKSGYAVLKKVTKKTSELVSSAIIKGLRPISDKVKTITFDNVLEFSQHAAIDKSLRSKSYFADPFSSWQRGSNENLNGLVRQYIPKNRPLSTVTHDELAMIQDRLNNRPRKRLGFKTPNGVFQASFKSVALRG